MFVLYNKWKQNADLKSMEYPMDYPKMDYAIKPKMKFSDLG